MANWDQKLAEYDDMLNDISDEEEAPKDKKKKEPQIEKPKEIPKIPQKKVEIEKPKEITKISQKDEIDLDQYEKELNNIDEDVNVKKQIKTKSPIKNNKDDDDELAEYEREKELEKNKQKPKNEKKNEPKKDAILDIIEKEEKYSNVNLMTSLLLINNEETMIKGGLSNKNIDQRLKANLKKKYEDLLKNKSMIEDTYKAGKLDSNSYLSNVNNCLQKHMKLFQEAKQEGDKSVCTRLAKRLELLTKEKENLSKNPKEFNSLLKTFFPNINISTEVDNKKYNSEKTEKNQKQEYKKPTQSAYPKQTIDLEIEEINSLPLEKKFLTFKKRYKNYHNLALYFSKNMKEIKENELTEKWLPLLQKGKSYLISLLNQENIDLKQILSNEFCDLTPEIFHGVPMNIYKDNLSDIRAKIKKSIEDENQYYDNIFTNKQMRAKAEESKKKIEEYTNYFNYIESLAADPWIPIPQYQCLQELKTFVIENKDIDHTDMKLNFKKFHGLQTKNCYIVYSISVNGVNKTTETPPSDDSNNLNYVSIVKLGESRRNVDREIYKKSILIEVMMQKSGFLGFGSKTIRIGKGEILLNDLLENNRYEGKINIEGDKNKNFQLEFGIYLRDPLKKDPKKAIDLIKIIKMYPKFDKNEGVEAYLKEPIKLTNNAPGQIEKKKDESNRIEEEKKEIAPLKQENNYQGPTNQIVILRHSKRDPGYQILVQNEEIPQGLTKQDILTPEDPDKCPCVSFMEKMIDLLQNARIEFSKEVDKEASKFAEEQYGKYFKRHKIVTSGIEQQRISAEDYKTFLDNGLDRDKKLLQFYNKKGLKEWSNFIQTRISFINEELKDFEA